MSSVLKENESEIRLHFKTATLEKGCRVRCDVLNLSEDAATSSEDEKPEQFQFVDLLGSDLEYNTQPLYGVPVDDSTYVQYRLRTANLDNTALTVTLYTTDPNAGPDEPHPVFGTAQISPVTFTASNSQGTVMLKIEREAGSQSVEVEYLVVRPTSGLACTATNITENLIDVKKGPLDMGHRGMGKCRSQKTAPRILENTIKCFKLAADHGADYVEFDVQVTKDNQVVVFHDFICRIKNSSDDGSVNNNHNGVNDGFRNAPVTDFTLKELRNLKATFVCNTAEPTDDEEEQLFPLLSELFQKVDPDLGFNVEIKFPTQLKNGEPEDGLATFRDMNEYVDLILKDIQRYAGKRKVLLSCFNPDVCIVLKLKQSTYPVQFLTQGEVERYDAFMDRRTRDVPIAINFAKAEAFMGVNPISEYILKDFSLVQRASDLGLIVMCWGAENNDPQVIEALKKNGVHVVIYDRLSEFIDPSKARRDTA